MGKTMRTVTLVFVLFGCLACKGDPDGPSDLLRWPTARTCDAPVDAPLTSIRLVDESDQFEIGEDAQIGYVWGVQGEQMTGLRVDPTFIGSPPSCVGYVIEIQNSAGTVVRTYDDPREVQTRDDVPTLSPHWDEDKLGGDQFRVEVRAGGLTAVYENVTFGGESRLADGGR